MFVRTCLQHPSEFCWNGPFILHPWLRIPNKRRLPKCHAVIMQRNCLSKQEKMVLLKWSAVETLKKREETKREVLEFLSQSKFNKLPWASFAIPRGSSHASLVLLTLHSIIKQPALTITEQKPHCPINLPTPRAIRSANPADKSRPAALLFFQRLGPVLSSTHDQLWNFPAACRGRPPMFI